jgi:hypothetical protein
MISIARFQKWTDETIAGLWLPANGKRRRRTGGTHAGLLQAHDLLRVSSHTLPGCVMSE